MRWTNDSITLTRTTNYLDRLYRVYPMANNLPRPLNPNTKNEFINLYDNGTNKEILKACLKIAKGDNIFPVKDSYIAYFKHDENAIDLNPETVNRIVGRIKGLGLDKAMEIMESPMETNRQLGQVAKQWIERGEIGVPIFYTVDEFNNFNGNKILSGSDDFLQAYVLTFINENEDENKVSEFEDKNKGIDFVAMFNGKLVIAEFKWLTDKGGHQDRQIDDALGLASLKFDNVVTIAVLDGVCWIEGTRPSRKSMFGKIDAASSRGDNVLSVLLLQDFLYSI